MIPADATPAVVARLRAAGCVFAEDEARLLIAAAETADELTALVDQRVTGAPLEHVLGWVEFCGRRVAVDHGVFVPRRRTEFLAETAIELLRPIARDERIPVAVDLCCGSAAVAAALIAAVQPIEIHAVDIEPAAVRCAERNVGDAGHVYSGDLYDPLPAALRGRVDVLVANGPYVPTAEIELMPREARIYEPTVTLDGGPEGVDVLFRVIEGAAGWLRPRGHLLIETSERQAPRLVAAATEHGLTPRVAGSERVGATIVVCAMAAP